MFVKTTKKQMYEKCFVVLICLLLFGNLVHRAVLCLCSDECVSIEIRPVAFCCEFHGVPIQPSSETCSQCVDIPIYTYTEKTTRVAKQLDSTFSTPTMIAHADNFNHSAYSSVSNTFDAASYFTPLYTVVLLI